MIFIYNDDDDEEMWYLIQIEECIWTGHVTKKNNLYTVSLDE